MSCAHVATKRSIAHGVLLQPSSIAVAHHYVIVSAGQKRQCKQSCSRTELLLQCLSVPQSCSQAFPRLMRTPSLLQQRQQQVELSKLQCNSCASRQMTKKLWQGGQPVKTTVISPSGRVEVQVKGDQVHQRLQSNPPQVIAKQLVQVKSNNLAQVHMPVLEASHASWRFVDQSAQVMWINVALQPRLVLVPQLIQPSVQVQMQLILSTDSQILGSFRCCHATSCQCMLSILFKR